MTETSAHLADHRAGRGLIVDPEPAKIATGCTTDSTTANGCRGSASPPFWGIAAGAALTAHRGVAPCSQRGVARPGRWPQSKAARAMHRPNEVPARWARIAASERSPASRVGGQQGGREHRGPRCDRWGSRREAFRRFGRCMLALASGDQSGHSPRRLGVRIRCHGLGLPQGRTARLVVAASRNATSYKRVRR
jgi:hypothetical protein